MVGVVFGLVCMDLLMQIDRRLHRLVGLIGRGFEENDNGCNMSSVEKSERRGRCLGKERG